MHSCRSSGALPKTWKKLGSSLNFFAKTAGRCFTPVIEIKPNTFTPHWNFYADTQLNTGKFCLQLWSLKKSSEARMSWNYVVKKWKEMAKLNYLAATGVIKSLLLPGWPGLRADTPAAKWPRLMCLGHGPQAGVHSALRLQLYGLEQHYNVWYFCNR